MENSLERKIDYNDHRVHKGLGYCKCGGALLLRNGNTICYDCIKKTMQREECQDCGAPIIHASGCRSCTCCGWSKCS
jgi:hypothetical protein